MYDEKAVNRRLRNLGTSPTFAVNESCQRMAAEGREVFNLGIGQSPFPVPENVVQALRDHASEKRYLPVQGLPELRESVARFHNESDGLSIEPDRVMIGPGSKELLFLLQLAFNGEIIIPTPSWVSYVPQARMIGHKIRFLHTSYRNRWRLQPSQITRMIARSVHPKRPRMLILNYPGNPCGLTYKTDELKALADAARENNIVILSDEIYGNLHHRDTHVSIARFYPEGTIISSGLSKWCAAGGWRLGTFAFPPGLYDLRAAMLGAASETYSTVSAPIQYAAVQAFLMSQETTAYLHNVRRILRSLGAECTRILQESRIDVHAPDGAFYLFPDFSKIIRRKRWHITSSVALAKRVLEKTGVATLPGKAFNRRAGQLNLRLAYVNFDGVSALKEASTTPVSFPIDQVFLHRYCPETLEAVHRIAEWVS